MRCILTTYYGFINERGLMDTERLKRLICGGGENTRGLTMENLFHLHQLNAAELLRMGP
jgi:hypothetical protein